MTTRMAESVELNGAFVRGVRPPKSGREDHWDGKLSGFGLRVAASGVKTWTLMYYNAAGIKRRYTLDSTEVLSAAAARKLAEKVLGKVANGADPAGERHATREAEKCAREAAKRPSDTQAPQTMDELCTLYIERYAAEHKKASSVAGDKQMINRDVLRAWAGRKPGDITRADVIALLDSVVRRGASVHANRVRSLLSKMFNFAIARGLLTVNPVDKTERPGEEHTRDRVLDSEEIRRLWFALDSMGAQTAAAFRLALLTGQRKSEVLDASWREFDLEKGWWTIPGERAKNHQSHRVPIVAVALDILKTLLDAPREDGRLFAQAEQNRHHERMQDIRKTASLENFEFHDLRRTMATGLAELRVEPVVISKLLNHTLAGVTFKHYLKFEYDEQKRAALLKWDARLREIVTGEKPRGEVIDLRPATAAA